MNELIPIRSDAIDGEARQTVNARDLHAFLGVKSEFRNWIKNRIEQFGFVQDVDFVAGNFLPGSDQVDYHLTLDMAKELSMVERTAKGKEARQYFLECERVAKGRVSNAALPDFTNPAEAARAWASEYEAKHIAQQKVIEMQPKADFHDRVTQSQDLLTIREVAKLLRTGERRMFGFLRREGLLMASNLPYQQFMDRGLFRLVETPWTDQFGRERISVKTCVTQKGLAFIQGLQDKLAMYQDTAA